MLAIQSTADNSGINFSYPGLMMTVQPLSSLLVPGTGYTLVLSPYQELRINCSAEDLIVEINSYLLLCLPAELAYVNALR